MSTCPRCVDSVPLEDAHDSVDAARCPHCGGHFLPPASTEQLLEVELGLSKAFLRELASHFAGARLPCVHCESRMSPVTVRGVPIDLCTDCFGSWLDRGELSRLSAGRLERLASSAPPAAAPISPAVTRAPVVRGWWSMQWGLGGELTVVPNALMRKGRTLGGLAMIGMLAAVLLNAGGTGIVMHDRAGRQFPMWFALLWGVAWLIPSLMLGTTVSAVARPGVMELRWSVFGFPWRRVIRGGARLRYYRRRVKNRDYYTVAVRAPGDTFSRKLLSSRTAAHANEIAEALREATGWPLDCE